jgi:membrane-bound lytic murein transglycosylase B
MYLRGKNGYCLTIPTFHGKYIFLGQFVFQHLPNRMNTVNMEHTINLKQISIQKQLFKRIGNIYMIFWKNKFLAVFTAFFALYMIDGAANSIHSQTRDTYFGSLSQKLVKDGFPHSRIQKLYKDPRTTFETKAISMYFVHREASLNYDQFTTPESILKARAYMAEHTSSLESARAKHGVDPEVITAIALVETRLGTYLGARPAFNILSTMAALHNRNVREIFWKQIKETTHLTRKEFLKKSNQKSEWAYRELKSLLTYTGVEEMDTVGIIGSYAGAIGICQFIPSNIMTLARDGNADGSVNLFDHPDAIHSIANYLRHYGWHPGIEEKKAFKVVYSYNHSSYYVNTILKIVSLLKKPA